MKVIHLRGILFGLLALACFVPPPRSIAQGPVATISAAPGTLVRWTAPGAERCSMRGRSWAALEGTCYYPIDLLDRLGPIAIAISGSGPKQFARISVEPNDYGTEEVADSAIGLINIFMVFGMKKSLVWYYNVKEPIGLKLNDLMVLVFGVLYLQFHLSNIATSKKSQPRTQTA